MTARMRTALCIVVVLAAFVTGVAAGRATAPVCHSVTEDSQITDCDDRDGRWLP